MGFWSYLVDRFAIVVGLVVGVLLSGLALLAHGVDVRAFAEVACVVCACVLAGLLLDWLRRREFYCRLREALDALDVRAKKLGLRLREISEESDEAEREI